VQLGLSVCVCKWHIRVERNAKALCDNIETAAANFHKTTERQICSESVFCVCGARVRSLTLERIKCCCRANAQRDSSRLWQAAESPDRKCNLHFADSSLKL